MTHRVETGGVEPREQHAHEARLRRVVEPRQHEHDRPSAAAPSSPRAPRRVVIVAVAPAPSRVAPPRERDGAAVGEREPFDPAAPPDRARLTIIEVRHVRTARANVTMRGRGS